MAMTAIKLLLAVLEALPILDKWFQQAVATYVKKQKEKNNAEFLQALERAVNTGDVKDLAASLGANLPD
jgi:hypothetical protein